MSERIYCRVCREVRYPDELVKDRGIHKSHAACPDCRTRLKPWDSNKYGGQS